MGGEYGTNRLDEDCHGFVTVIKVGKIPLDVQGNTILNWNFQTVLSEFVWIRIDAVSGALCNTAINCPVIQNEGNFSSN
jgi:hypothetical protein